jgi:hypothetical protein
MALGRSPRIVAALISSIAILLAGCAGGRNLDPRDPGDLSAGAPPAAEKEEGPPRPPLREELLEIGELPTGSSLAEGLPGGNPRVNQDSSGQAQNETTIIASPANPQVLVGGWNDYFNVNPGQNTVIGYGWSSDGGQTWQSSRVDFSTLPSSQSTGDPALTADSQGNIYLGILAYSGTASGILVAKSTDGGATFAEPVRLDNGGDKEFLTVDLANDNVYVVWENGSMTGQTIFFSKSTDLGESYTPRQAISNSASGGNGAYPAVGPDGEIYVVWSNFSTTLWFDRSLDQGNTWLPTDIAAVTGIDKPRDPLQGGFRNPMIPAIAVDRTTGPNRGRIYIVWPDERFGDPDTLISWSDDKGDTWSAPLRVNDDAVGNDADQFFPWVATDDNGHVHVTFLDRREDPDGLLLAMYLATSTDGGVSFGPNIRISDGIYGPSNFGFLGDYTGAAVSGANKIHPLWPDGRFGDEDIFTKAVDLADYDEDGILNDGDGDGQYAGNRCTLGQVSACDDNCPGEPNPDQVDLDEDRVGDACDNCPGTFNTDQADVDRDGFGDACDQCPGQVGGDGTDPDLDGVANCTDNCPDTPNVDQLDGDNDGFGDACDICPGTSLNDADDDSICGDVDNCPDRFNPLQSDFDTDGVGDPCDVCPDQSDPGQADGDGDGAGDACDCQPTDGNDREPAEVLQLTANRSGAGATALSWTGAAGSDAYSITRGTISGLGSSEYGGCLAEGLDATGFEDPEVPPAGEGYIYLVQGQNFDCGVGPLGYTSDETVRVNSDPSACSGQAFTDLGPDGETAVDGTVSGSFTDTLASDGTLQQITEVLTSGGKPTLRYSFLEHRWAFDVPAGGRIELHVEGFRTSSSDGDNFVFEYSDDGGATWNPVSVSSLPFADNDADVQGTLPATLSGSVIVRVVDTNRSPGGQFLDTVSIDQLFIRIIP